MALIAGTDPVRSVSLLFFFAFFAFACQGRFLAIFFSSFGLGNDDVGYLLAGGGLVGLISNPFWTGVCDYVRGKRTVLLISTCAACVCIVLYMVPWTGLGDSLALLPGSSSLFVWMFIVRCAYSFFFVPVHSILDAIAVQTLPNPKGDYEKCRLWGAVSWALASSAIIGPLLDTTGSWIMVLGFLLSSALLLVVVFTLVPQDDWSTKEGRKRSLSRVGSRDSMASEGDAEAQAGDSNGCHAPANGEKVDTGSQYTQFDEEERPQRGKKVDQNIVGIYCSIIGAEGISSVSFFLVIFVMGIATSLVEHLVFLFFVQELNASSLMCGMSVAITVMWEIPIFHNAERVHRALNMHQLILIAGVCYVGRVVAYTMFSNPWMVLLVEPFHGVTFALLQMSSVHYAARLSPKGLETTTQGLKDTIHSLGTICGMLFGGIVMEKYGSVVMFRAAAVMVTAAMVMYAAVQWKQGELMKAPMQIQREDANANPQGRRISRDLSRDEGGVSASQPSGGQGAEEAVSVAVQSDPERAHRGETQEIEGQKVQVRESQEHDSAASPMASL